MDRSLQPENRRRRLLWTRRQFAGNSALIMMITVAAAWAFPRLWPVEYNQLLEWNFRQIQVACNGITTPCPNDVLVFTAGSAFLAAMVALEITLALFVLRVIVWPIVFLVMRYSPRFTSAWVFAIALVISAAIACMLVAIPYSEDLSRFVGEHRYGIFLTFLFITLFEMFLRGPTEDTRCILDFVSNLVVFSSGFWTFAKHGAVDSVVLFTVPAAILTLFQFIWILRLFGGKQTRAETQEH